MNYLTYFCRMQKTCRNRLGFTNDDSKEKSQTSDQSCSFYTRTNHCSAVSRNIPDSQRRREIITKTYCWKRFANNHSNKQCKNRMRKPKTAHIAVRSTTSACVLQTNLIATIFDRTVSRTGKKGKSPASPCKQTETR